MSKVYKELGSRIKRLREELGISQQRLAVFLGVSRSTISQIEIGVRKVSADELLKLSEIFNISVEQLLGLRKEPEIIIQEAKKRGKVKPQVRINVPQKNLEKFKEVLLYILNKVGSKPNIGETVIYKLLYFIDFDFYEKYEEQLIGATYIKNRYVPTAISEYSHNDVPWLTTKDQGIIEYESVFYRTPPYSVREYNEDIQ